MPGLLAPFARAETYRGLLFGVSALPLGVVALVVLATGWGITVGLAITPLVVPLLLGLRFVVRQLAQAEAFLVRELLGAPVTLPSQRGQGGFWQRLGHALTDGVFWKQQAYLLLRIVLGVPLAIIELALLTTGAVGDRPADHVPLAGRRGRRRSAGSTASPRHSRSFRPPSSSSSSQLISSAR